MSFYKAEYIWMDGAEPTPKLRSKTKIVDKVVHKKDVPTVVPMEPVRVTPDTLGSWARQLRQWGFADVPEEYLKLK